jgi:glycosyltransferase involved in cell wall biosynthesis
MVIAFDAKRIVSNGTGLGSYGRTLVNDLSLNPSLSLRLYAPDAGRDDLRRQVTERPNVRFVYPSSSIIPFSKAYWRTHAVVRQLSADGVDLYHGLSGELPIGLRRTGVRSVVTIHDLIFLRHPEYYHWVDTKLYAWKFRRTLQEADRIIAISECTKRDIVELGHIDESRIQVVYQSCSPRFNISRESDVSNYEVRGARCEDSFGHETEPLETGRRYMLSVGTIEERKNLLLALKALRHLPDDVALVAVGRPTPYVRQLADYARRHQLTHRLMLFHNVTNSQLPHFYAHAELFVYPSRYEGFGIPIIEAISSGLPVAACTGSCLEEAGGPHSLYVDPDDDEALADAVKQLLRGATGREERIRRSQQYITRFTGATVAQQMLDVYKSLI